jgi:hypothetical protein
MPEAEDLMVREVGGHVLQEPDEAGIGVGYAWNTRLVPLVRTRVQEELLAVYVTQEVVMRTNVERLVDVGEDDQELLAGGVTLEDDVTRVGKRKSFAGRSDLKCNCNISIYVDEFV